MKMSFFDARARKRAVFTHEKRFCLDGSDGLAYFSSYKRLKRSEFSKHQRGGGGSMVWTGIFRKGKTPLVFVKNNIDAAGYNAILNDVYQPFVEQYFPSGCVFQQYGAPARTAKRMQECYMDEGMPVLSWPARSQDMNVIENCSGLIVRALYHGGRQFDTIEDLKEALIMEWEKRPLEEVETLISSISARI